MILDVNKLFVHLDSFVPQDPRREFGDPWFLLKEESLDFRLNNLRDWYDNCCPPLKQILKMK